MVNIKRWLKHLFMPPWRWRTAFPSATLTAIEEAISQSERKHRGELRFVVENSLPPMHVWRGRTPANRAQQVFADLRIWDTEENSGVLIYLLLADREVHIVADRGIARRVAQTEWDAIASSMQQAFQRGDFREGVQAGIECITKLLTTHFPADSLNPNELPDRPVVIKD
ncbi:TPM domain-containing protein [Methylomicrobium sp. Wu6]|uniref:TPM domain-containing protein n=1 Tax=Methylomicrobium sp. Wu6 TaxID=3107928 RepID=UPI002DD69910|nr:TPM domain-containing protein [Methylomicrobium sp. Wu6]MEC4747102.1 TPM domain-containing protein [Methylomicrobium sp. Wu6]